VKYAARSLRLDVEDGDICLRNEKRDLLQSADAAAYLLDPFLFPDLAETPLPSESGEIVYRGLKSVG
jgi:hypothetical protein